MISKIFSKLIVLLIFLYAFQVFGQEKKFSGDPDSTFKTARALKSNNQRKQAQNTLLFILTKYPDYHDFSDYLATTYRWDGDYKKAKKEFEVILEKDQN
jgi:Tfp pilus assembly protein PilF